VTAWRYAEDPDRHVKAERTSHHLVVPAIEVAIIVHAGTHTDIDLAYGALARYIAQHTLAVEGPIREYYVVGAHDTPDESAWRTEIGWPIFQTGDSASASTRHADRAI
jgi:effector-binding domain-containing protein